MKRTTIILPDDLALLVEREAKRHETSVAEITRRALRAHVGLGEGPRARLPFVGLGRSGYRTTGRDVEAILAEEWADDIERHRDR